jgi:hypothetical protein
MPACQIDSRWKRRLSRAAAFEAQGVALEHPSHSWSGVRGRDGAVVIAIRAACIQVDDGGCSCLLWSPAIGAEEWMERATHEERLGHCRLAVRLGTAEGLLAHGDDAVFYAGELIALVVVKVGTQYWGRWGSVARAEDSSRFVVAGMSPAEACFAA